MQCWLAPRAGSAPICNGVILRPRMIICPQNCTQIGSLSLVVMIKSKTERKPVSCVKPSWLSLCCESHVSKRSTDFLFKKRTTQAYEALISPLSHTSSPVRPLLSGVWSKNANVSILICLACMLTHSSK